MPGPAVDGEGLAREGYERALALVHACATPDGFLASPTQGQNYRRVWGRDGVVIALAALLTDEPELRRAARSTLETLARHQGPHGEIPSNVDPVSGRVSYGGTTGRVDADLWFVIGCGEYWRATGDRPFLERLLPALERVRFLLGAWEFNARGLLYVPLAGDWADEYLHNGYVLYDQLLYLQAQRTLASVHRALHGSGDGELEAKVRRLRRLIRANYWFDGDDASPQDRYHDVLYEKGLKSASRCAGQYWLPTFSPTGYGHRFDAFGNVLASLLGVADRDQSDRVDGYIAQELTPKALLLPAFHPVIEPVDEHWKDLQMSFSYTFKNAPYEYHNGGLWPMLTGFHVASLASRGKQGEARRFLEAVHRANASPGARDGEPWSFPEFLHGQTLEPGGARPLGWSAAAAVIGHHALHGQAVFRIGPHEC